MAIRIDKPTRVICQGLNGSQDASCVATPAIQKAVKGAKG